MHFALHHSLAELDAAQWDACFPGGLEGYSYLWATEQAGLADFQWRYLAAYRDGQLIAAIPAFFIAYPLDTTLHGRAQRAVRRVQRLFPRFMVLKLACLGSPVTEAAEMGFHPAIADAEKSAIAAQMLAFFTEQAAAAGYRLCAVKDYLPDRDPWWDSALNQQRFQSLNGLPLATLAIDFPSADAYLARLSAATRKDMRRKLRRRAEVRVGMVTQLDPALLPRIMTLYTDTRQRADMQFETLTAEFFQGIMQQSDPRARCVMYFVGEELLAFNLLLCNEDTLLDKYFCMDAARGRDYHLYFLSWFVNIDYCLQRGMRYFQSGAAGYTNKRRLGSALAATRLAFRHRNPLLQFLLQRLSPWLQPDLSEDKNATEATIQSFRRMGADSTADAVQPVIHEAPRPSNGGD